MRHAGSRYLGFGLAWMAGWALLLNGPAAALAAEPAAIGHVDRVNGQVTVMRGAAKHAAKEGESLFEHDLVETAADASVGLVFNDATVMSLGPKSHVALDNYQFDAMSRKGKFLASLRRGSLAMTTGELTQNTPGSVRIKTPRVIMGVRGTRFAVTVDDSQDTAQ